MHPILIPIFLAGGWLLGTALVYATDSLAMTRRLKTPRCVHCQAERSFLDLLLLRPCRQCHQSRGRKAWIVPLASAAALIALWAVPPARLTFWPALIVYTYFAVVIIMDLEHRVVLHPVSITGAFLGLLVGSWLNGGMSGAWLRGILVSLGGGAAGFLAMYALYGMGELFRRWMSRRRGEEIEEVALGFGDVNISGVLGLMVGFPAVILVLVAAIVFGGLFSGLYILVQALRRQYQSFTAIPYAPFLILAGVVLFYLIAPAA